MNKSQAGVWYNTVFGLLTDLKGLSWSVKIAGRSVKVGQEELLSVYFHQIRKRIERNENRRISSCFVAVTGLLTSGAKQILKASLTLAGFDNCTMISSTTAMAISYSQLFRTGELSNRKMHTSLFIYTSANLVEIAAADVSSDRVMVKNLCGRMDIKKIEEKLEEKLRNLLLDYILLGRGKYNRIILCFATNAASHQSELIYKTLLKVMPKTLWYSDVMDVDVKTDIVRVAALLDSQQNGYSNSVATPVPLYNSVHPYKICVEIKGKQYTLSDFNNDKLMQWSLGRVGDLQKMNFIEVAKAGLNQWTVGAYHLVYRHYETYKTNIEVSMQTEGRLFIILNTPGELVQSNVKSMTNFGWKDLFAVAKPILEEIAQRIEKKLDPPSSSNTNQNTAPPSHTIDGASNELLEDLKTTLTILVEKTKNELRTSTLTHTAHRDNIESKIAKCEELMKSSKIKVKQLAIEKGNLERAAKFIK